MDSVGAGFNFNQIATPESIKIKINSLNRRYQVWPLLDWNKNLHPNPPQSFTACSKTCFVKKKTIKKTAYYPKIIITHSKA